MNNSTLQRRKQPSLVFRFAVLSTLGLAAATIVTHDVALIVVAMVIWFIAVCQNQYAIGLIQSGRTVDALTKKRVIGDLVSFILFVGVPVGILAIGGRSIGFGIGAYLVVLSISCVAGGYMPFTPIIDVFVFLCGNLTRLDAWYANKRS